LTQKDIRHAIEQCIDARVKQIQFYAILAIPPISPGIVDHLPAGFPGGNDSHVGYLAGIASFTVDLMRKAGIKCRHNQPLVILDCMPLIPAIGTRLQGIAFPQWSEYVRQMEQVHCILLKDAGDAIKITAGLDELSYLLQMILERSGPLAGTIIHFACRNADFDVPTPEMVRTALDEYGLDLSSFQKEYPADRLPYAGLISRLRGLFA